MVSHVYPAEFQLNKANSFDTEACFLNLDLPIKYGEKCLYKSYTSDIFI